jgi:hypothetical protein
MMAVRPLPIKTALKFCRAVHRRLPIVVGGMWSLGLEDGEALRGVAIVGRPSARLMDNGKRLEVTRVAVEPGAKNGCSMLYGAASRAGKAMGARDMFTYIHGDELGISLKASGWVEDKAPTDGGQWSRSGRQRELAIDPNPKRRWWTPWSEYLRAATPGTAGTRGTR